MNAIGQSLIASTLEGYEYQAGDSYSIHVMEQISW